MSISSIQVNATALQNLQERTQQIANSVLTEAQGSSDDLRSKQDPANGLAELKQVRVAHQSNVEAIKVQDAMVGSLLDIVA